MKRTLPVIGMACASCSAHVERTLNGLRGVQSASVSLASRTALIDYDPSAITLEEMKAAINGIGFDLVIEADRSVEAIERRAYVRLRRRTLLSWLFALLTMAISMSWISLGSTAFANQAALLLALANLVFCGRRFYVSAWRQLLHKTANMDSLVALSTAIAFLFSVFNTFWGEQVWGVRGMDSPTYFDASVMIITFVLTGRLLEEKAKDGTASSIRQLMGMQPKTARILSDGKLEEVPLSTVEVGDVLEVRAGEKIPVDGEVISAESFMSSTAAYVDESMITGEPTPAEKQAGAQVLAGTIPSQGKLRMRARQIGEATALRGPDLPGHVSELVDPRRHRPPSPRHPLGRGRARHCLSLRDGPRHAYRADGQYRQGCPAADPRQGRYRPGTAAQGGRPRDRQDRHADHPPRRPRLHEVGPPAARGTRAAQAPRPRGHEPSAPGGH